MKEHELKRVLQAADEAVTVSGLEEVVRLLEQGLQSHHASIARHGAPLAFNLDDFQNQRENGVGSSSSDKRQLSTILPAVEAAVHRVFKAPGASQADALAVLLDASITRPCLLLDAGGRLLWASPSAASLIAREGGAAPQPIVRAARALVMSTRLGADPTSAPRRVRLDGEDGAPIWVGLRVLRAPHGGLCVVAECSAALDPPGLVARLGVTRAEAAVLALLADGQANAAIAGRLHVSTETVKTHVRSVLRKLGARSRVQAALIALGCRPPGLDAAADADVDAEANDDDP